MEDFIIIDYLKNKGLYNLTEDQFIERFKDVMANHYIKTQKESSITTGEYCPIHPKESRAKEIVSHMYHMSNGIKQSGEEFTLDEAKDICERYSGMLPQQVDKYDIYVAVNSHYHDYCVLFANWFGENMRNRIVDAAIIFWFKDSDFYYQDKMDKYF